jgi:DNA mismatch repair ATPase MutS
MYGNAKNVHLKTAIDSTGGSSASIHGGSGASIKYLREVSAGPCDLRSGYGILMAEQCGFPSAVLLDARELRTVIRDKFPVLIGGGGGGEISSEEEQSLGSLTTLLQHLSLLKTRTQLDDHAVRASLSKLRAAIPECTAAAIIAWLATLASSALQKKPLDEVTPVRNNRAGQDLSAEMM